jgi:enoyl-CoA hydratase/carnithine racemase
MRDFETIRVRVKHGVATITLTRPEVKNAFNEAMLDELLEAYGSSFSRARVIRSARARISTT